MYPRNRVPLAIVGIYFLFGVGWILFSDLYFLRFLNAGSGVFRVEIFKGLTYVALTSVGLYWLVRFHFRKLLDMQAVLEDRNRELQDAMAAVREEKARYMAMIMAIGDGVSVQDRDFRIIYQNRVLKDLSKREILVLGCVTLFIFWIGIYPQTFLSRMEPTVKAYLTQVQQKYQAGVQMEEGNKVKVALGERQQGKSN